MDAVARTWQQVAGTQPAPPTWTVAATAALALVLVASPSTWPVVRHVVTTAHEGAHGVAALLTGRRLRGIRLHSDSSGLAVSSGPSRGPGMVATLLAGYPGPALLGLTAAAVLATGRSLAVLWGLSVLLALLLLQIRNLFGLWSVLVTGAVLAAVTAWAAPQVQSAFAYGVTWFLLLAPPRTVLELHRSRRRGGGAVSDADQLARLTGLPGLVWVGVLAALTLAASTGGVLLLLGRGIPGA